MDERQGTLHNTGQGINALAEQGPAAEQDVEGGVRAVVDEKGRIVHQVGIAVRHFPRRHDRALRLLVVAIKVGKGRHSIAGWDVQDDGITVGGVGLEPIHEAG